MHAPMEIFLSFTKTSMATILALFIILLASLLWATRTILTKPSRNKKKAAAPEARGAWPLIGHLHLLGGPQPAHIVLGNMADKYGPIFTIKTGVHRALVISDQEIAKECFTTNDKAFANRPKTIALEVLGYGGAMFGFSPYGPFWREMRKIVTLKLLSNQRLEMFKHVREEEVRASVNALHKLCTINESSVRVLVEMKRWFGDVTLNVIMKIIFGKSVAYMGNIRENDLGRWKKALMEFIDMFGRFVVGDAVPFLRWFDVGGHEKAMRKIAKELDVVVEAWLMEHKEKRSGDGAFKSEDFMDLMLSILHDVNAQLRLGHHSDTINKAICLGLTLAASDTTTVTLTWALSLLLNHPNILSKTQLELDNNVGRERQVNESDLKNLIYLKA